MSLLLSLTSRSLLLHSETMAKCSKTSETNTSVTEATGTPTQPPTKKQRKPKDILSGKITLPWHANKQAKVWDLIHLVAKDEYFKGLFGKKDLNEVCHYFPAIHVVTSNDLQNTTGESKTQLFICLAKDLWSEFIGNDADAQELGTCIKNQFTVYILCSILASRSTKHLGQQLNEEVQGRGSLSS